MKVVYRRPNELFVFLLVSSLLAGSCSWAENSKDGKSSFTEDLKEFLEGFTKKAEEGRVLGLIDFILTPTRVTRNMVSWFMSGISFFGVLIQSHTFYKAIVDHKKREEEEEEEAQRRQYFEFLHSLRPDPTFSKRTNPVHSPPDQYEFVKTKRSQSQTKKANPTTYVNKKSPPQLKLADRKYGSRSFNHRSGFADISQRLSSLKNETCVKKALCGILKRANTSTIVRHQVNKLRNDVDFQYKQDLQSLSTLKDCEESFVDCSRSSEELANFFV